jgi:hypothetical protein
MMYLRRRYGLGYESLVKEVKVFGLRVNDRIEL